MKASTVYRRAAELMFRKNPISRLPHYVAMRVSPDTVERDRDFILGFYEGGENDFWQLCEGSGYEAIDHVLPLLLMSEIAKDSERKRK